jgi:hypothetical protein
VSVCVICHRACVDATHATRCVMEITISRTNRRWLQVITPGEEIETSQVACCVSNRTHGWDYWMVTNLIRISAPYRVNSKFQFMWWYIGLVIEYTANSLLTGRLTSWLTDKPTNWQINRQIGWPTDRPINRLSEQPADCPTEQQVGFLTDQPADCCRTTGWLPDKQPAVSLMFNLLTDCLTDQPGKYLHASLPTYLTDW